MQKFHAFGAGLQRRMLLKMAMSAAALFSVLGLVTQRSDAGTWVLRRDDS